MTRSDSVLIDWVRLLANYLVVLMHAWAASQYFATKSYEYVLWDFVCNAVCASAMPGLFLLSGYLLITGFSYSVYMRKIKSRVKRLLVPLVAWNAVFIVFYLLMAQFVPRLAKRVESFGLTSAMGVVNKLIGLWDRPLDAPLWYLKTVFVYAVFAVPIYWLLKKRQSWVLYLISGYWVALSIMDCGDVFKYSFPAYSIFAFVLGCHLAALKKSVFVLSRKEFMIFPFIGMGMLYFWLIQYGGRYTFLRDLAFTMELPFLFGIVRRVSGMLARVPLMETLKASSFFVYASHFLFCSIILHALAAKALVSCYDGWGALTILIGIFTLVGGTMCVLVWKLGSLFAKPWFWLFDGTGR